MPGACRIFEDAERAERISRYALSVYPNDPSLYVILANTYAKVGRYEDAERVESLMKERGVKRRPGTSKVRINGELRTYLPNDPKIGPEVRRQLKEFQQNLIADGYAPDTTWVLQNVDEETKKHLLCLHSELVALAHAILHTPAHEPITIYNDLRICFHDYSKGCRYVR